MGEAFREPALYRHRRDSCLSRRLRLAPGEYSQAPPAHLPLLRSGPAIHLLLGNDRESPGAHRRAHREPGASHRPKRGAERREIFCLLQPAGREPRARHTPLLYQRDAPHRGVVSQARAPDDRVHDEPAEHGDSRHLSQERDRARRDASRSHPRLSRRLSSEKTPRDRSWASRRHRARRRLDQRARARDRYRRARRRRDLGLPRNHRLDMAASRTGGTAHRHLRRDPRRE